MDIFYRCSVLWLTLWTFSVDDLRFGLLCGHFLWVFCAVAHLVDIFYRHSVFVDIFYRCSVLWLTLWTFSEDVLYCGLRCGHFL